MNISKQTVPCFSLHDSTAMVIFLHGLLPLVYLRIKSSRPGESSVSRVLASVSTNGTNFATRQKIVVLRQMSRSVLRSMLFPNSTVSKYPAVLLFPAVYCPTFGANVPKNRQLLNARDFREFEIQKIPRFNGNRDTLRDCLD